MQRLLQLRPVVLSGLLLWLLWLIKRGWGLMGLRRATGTHAKERAENGLPLLVCRRVVEVERHGRTYRVHRLYL